MSLICLFRTKLAATSWTRCKRNGNEEEPESGEGKGLKKIVNLLIKTMFPVKLDLHTSVIDADVVHQASNEVNQTTSPQRSQDTTQGAQSTIQPNLPITTCFPLKSRTKHGAISVTRASVILSMVFTMKLSISGEML